MSPCVSGLISGEPLSFYLPVRHSSPCKIIKVHRVFFLFCFFFTSHSLSILKHIAALSQTWAGTHRIVWASTRSLKRKKKKKKKLLLGLGFISKAKYASFIPPHFCWWGDSYLNTDGSQLAMSNVITGTSLQVHIYIYTHTLSTDQSWIQENKWSHLKSNRKIILI